MGDGGGVGGLRDDIGCSTSQLLWTPQKARATRRWQAVMINMVGFGKRAAARDCDPGLVTDLGRFPRRHIDVEMIAMF